MSSTRRLSVIEEYGSLEAYREYVVAGFETRRQKYKQVFDALGDGDLYEATYELVVELSRWQADRKWVDAELASDAEAA